MRFHPGESSIHLQLAKSNGLKVTTIIWQFWANMEMPSGKLAVHSSVEMLMETVQFGRRGMFLMAPI